ncbi:hypothetical protein [Neisseria flavescens]|uniref:hypothetical protein n=1 Tax=Neisseria flavescens TaxID=484 RepID=UPI00177D4255|nr:hypothetical protein [Neisseria flavescens]
MKNSSLELHGIFSIGFAELKKHKIWIWDRCEYGNETVGLTGSSLIAGFLNGVIEKNSW